MVTLKVFTLTLMVIVISNVVVRPSEGATTTTGLCDVNSMNPPMEISLGIDERDAFQAEVKVDIYVPPPACAATAEDDDLPKLIVFACGGSVPKEQYSMLATGLSYRNYAVVMVLDRAVNFGVERFNFASSFDIANAIGYAENQTDIALDTSTIVIMGHSYGVNVLIGALNGVCTPPICMTPHPVPLHPNIKVAALYGASLYSVAMQGMQADWVTTDNNDFPLFIINGANDDITFRNDTTTGEGMDEGTYARLDPTKVVAVVDDLNHFSIANEPNPDGPGLDRPVPDRLSRQDQVDIIVDIMTYWIETSLEGFTGVNHDICQELTTRGEVGIETADDDGSVLTYDIIDCDAQIDPTDVSIVDDGDSDTGDSASIEDDDDSKRISSQALVGIVIGAVVTLGIVVVVFSKFIFHIDPPCWPQEMEVEERHHKQSDVENPATAANPVPTDSRDKTEDTKGIPHNEA